MFIAFDKYFNVLAVTDYNQGAYRVTDKLSLDASLNFWYDCGSGGTSKDCYGKLCRVGGCYIGYYDNGKISHIGDSYISYYDYEDGRISTIGDIRVGYDYERRLITKVGNVDIQYHNEKVYGYGRLYKIGDHCI